MIVLLMVLSRVTRVVLDTRPKKEFAKKGARSRVGPQHLSHLNEPLWFWDIFGDGHGHTSGSTKTRLCESSKLRRAVCTSYLAEDVQLTLNKQQ